MSDPARIVYRDYTLDALEREYAIEQSVPDFEAYLKRCAESSRRVRNSRAAQLDLRYGPAPAERLDVFTTEAPGAPVLVFIHGGAWRGSSKESRAFPADVFCPAGMVYVSLEYPLAPGATLDEIVDAARRGITWVAANAASFGGDPGRVFVAGNSAGAHLAAMACCTSSGPGTDTSVVRGVVTISGVFDLTPLRLTRANSWLQMDDAIARRNSPIAHLPAQGVPLLCAVGADEPSEFRRQSRDYAAAWTQAGFRSAFVEIAAQNHFSIIEELGRESGALVGMIKRFIASDANILPSGRD